MITVVELVRYDKLTRGGQSTNGHEVDRFQRRLEERGQDRVDVVDVPDADRHVVHVDSEPHPA